MFTSSGFLANIFFLNNIIYNTDELSDTMLFICQRFNIENRNLHVHVQKNVPAHLELKCKKYCTG